MATRWGICGAGKIASDFCNAIRLLPETEHQIVAVAASSAVRAAAFAKRFNIPNSYGSYETLAQQENIDVVYINLYVIAHVDTCLMFINAGKNVLCEKPMALSFEGCKKVTSAAREKGVFFAEGFWSRYFPVYDQIRSRVDSGELGDITMVNAHFTFSLSYPEARPEDGMGFFIGIGCYPIMFANMIFKGRPEAINIQSNLGPNGADTDGALILKYSGGRFASLSYCSEADWGMSNAIVRGSKGNLQIPDFMWTPTELILQDGQKLEFPFEDFKGNYPRPGGFVYQIQAVRDCLLKGLKESPLIPHQDSEDISYILDQCVQQLGIKYPCL